MTARRCTRLATGHRAEVSVDNRTGTVWVRLRHGKRGKPVSFTVDQWAEFTRAVKAGELDGLTDGLAQDAELLRRNHASDVQDWTPALDAPAGGIVCESPVDTLADFFKPRSGEARHG